ncbi:MAG: transporter substrate-binding protein, partial [Thermomicrobiales bacterium]|nr:transporter substrate-binding protein [Thermomicrobiales bacterium]
MIELRGISWDHPRGHDPMVATAVSYAAAHPDVCVIWDTRSLKDFGDFPIERLTDTYDLLVIDHPFVGFAAATSCLRPL